MALRKEQVLVLAVLAVALLQYRSIMGGSESRLPPLNPKQKNYTAQAVLQAPEIAPPPDRRRSRDLFWEPSETQPLPPRQLKFPDRAPLSIVPPPITPGLDLGHAHALRMAGDAVEGVTLAAGGSGGEAAAPSAPATTQEPEGKSWERWATTYDQFYVKGQTTPLLGRLIPEGMDKYRMEELQEADFATVPVKYQRYMASKERLENPALLEGVVKIVLARTTRNEVERAIRRVPETGANALEREKLIDLLLAKARDEGWIYDEALRQADIAIKVSDQDLDAIRLKVRVLRQKGDIAGEFELYRNLTGRHENSSFRYEGLGIVKARYGLYDFAEADLRTAVGKAEVDPRPRSSLAAFLLDRGRVAEALREANRAANTLNILTPGSADQARVVAIVTSCRLAAGDVQGARQILGQAGDASGRPALAILPGAVDYADPAAGPQAALNQFRQAGSVGSGSGALLGAGACLVRLGQWQDAHSAFDSAAQQAPLLRDSAYAAQGLIHLKIGQKDTALQWLDRALEADPQDAYALYLRGRVLRELGLLPQALDALQAALRQRDDFLHAIAEVAMVHWQMAQEGQGRDAAVHLSAAARYADRLVALEATPSREFLELQGTLQFHAADLKAAETAFTAAVAAGDEQGQLYSKVGLALVEYARGRVEEARTLLERLMQSGLPPEHPMRQYAQKTIAAIDDHAEKERLEDRFERGGLGAIWLTEAEAGIVPAIQDNRLEFKGTFTKTGEAWAERAGVLPKAGKFLAVATRMQAGPAHKHDNAFAGLRLYIGQPKAPPELRIQFGLQGGKPWLQIEDGRSGGAEKEKEREPVRGFEKDIQDFQAGGEQLLELRVIPRDASLRQFQLLCSWNGVVVHSRALTTLHRENNGELHTQLVVSGPNRNQVEVRFDDFQLERRKETAR